jgi:hypothetical protein
MNALWKLEREKTTHVLNKHYPNFFKFSYRLFWLRIIVNIIKNSYCFLLGLIYIINVASQVMLRV